MGDIIQFHNKTPPAEGQRMKPGTIVDIEGRGLATVVYHNIDGYGVIWGEQNIDPLDLPEPEAMLRNPYPSAKYECVGEEYRLIVDAA